MLTRLGEAETVDSLGEVVHAHVFRFAAVLEEFLRGETLFGLRSNTGDGFAAVIGGCKRTSLTRVMA